MSDENKKSDLRIFAEELLNRNRNKLSSEDCEMLQKVKKDDEMFSKLLDKIISKESYSLLRHLSIIEDDTLDTEILRDVYGKRFDDFEKLMEELEDSGLIGKDDEKTGEIYFSSLSARDAVIDDDAKLHALASKYYLEKAEKTGNFEDRLNALNHSLKSDRLDETIELFLESSRNAKGYEKELIVIGEELLKKTDRKKEGEILRMLGSLSYDCNLFNRAGEYYNRAVEVYMEYSHEDPVKYMPELAKILNNFGNVCHAMGKYEDAENHFNWAATIFTKLNSPQDLAITLENLGMMYVDAEKYDNAEKIFKDVIELKKDVLKGEDIPSIARIYQRLAETFWKQDRLDEAEKTFKEMLEFLEGVCEGDNLSVLAGARSALASFYVDTGRSDDALEVVHRVMSDFNLIPETRTRVYMIGAKAYELKGERDLAADLYMKAACLSFILFRQYGIYVTNFLFLLEKVEELSSGEMRGDATLMRQAIMRNYYGAKKLVIQDIECGKKGQMILNAVKGKSISSFKVESQEEMAAYLIANDIN